MSRVDGLTLTFNYHVRNDGAGDRYASMRNSDVEADAVYLDVTNDGVLFGVKSDDENISIEIPDEQIEKLRAELNAREG